MGYFALCTNDKDPKELLRVAKRNLNLILEATFEHHYNYLVTMAILDIEKAEKILFEGGVLDSTAAESNLDNPCKIT